MSIETLLAENTAALKELAAALTNKGTTAAPAKAEAPAKEPRGAKAPKAEKAPKAAAAKVDYVKEMAGFVMDMAAMGTEQRAAAVKVLAKHGAKRVKELKPEKYAAAHAELAALHAKFSKADDVDDDDDLVDGDDLEDLDEDDTDDLDDLED